MAVHTGLPFIIGTIIQVTYGCPVRLSSIYSPEHTNAIFNFNVIPAKDDVYSVTRQYDNSTVKSLLYIYHDRVEETITDITFIGDISTGNISFVYEDVTRSEAGVYVMIRNIGFGSFSSQCASLFILGTPDVPTIVINRIPDEGEDLVLTCSGSRSTTVPAGHNLALVYLWIVDDIINPDIPSYKYTTNREQLTVINVKVTDAGKQVTCRAKEDVIDGLSSENSTMVSLTIAYGPENIKFYPENLEYELEESSQFGPVNCYASCFPMCKYNWDKRDGTNQASSNGTLYINSLTRNDAGPYSCNATNNGKVGRPQYTDTKQLYINVIFGPDHITFDPPQDVYEEVENTTLRSIKCTASCNPNCTYTWEKIGQTGQIGVDGILSLGYLQRSMTGIYRCTATNPERMLGSGSTSMKDLQLLVIFGPDNITFDPPQDVYEEVGNTTLPSIDCTTSCYPVCSYTWEKIGQTGQIGVDGILTLGYIQRSMAGIYRCTAMNSRRVGGSDSMATRKLSLHVIYGPDSAVISDGHSLNITEGTTHANITCTSDCYPSCNSSWASITNGTADVFGDVLSLGRITRNQTGKYKCTTSNTDPGYQRTADATISITVHYGNTDDGVKNAGSTIGGVIGSVILAAIFAVVAIVII